MGTPVYELIVSSNWFDALSTQQSTHNPTLENIIEITLNWECASRLITLISSSLG